MVLTAFAIAAGVLTLATLLIAAAWRRARGRPLAWRRLLAWHAALLALHFIVTMPVLLGLCACWLPETRRDESAYSGPRFADDGRWLLQSRDSLRAEVAARGDDATPPTRSPFAVDVRARDGTPLRAFLVPPRDGAPLFTALLVHGLFRGAFELEPVGSMFRDLGGEVLLLEMRRHGGSGGDRFTFGRDEPGDLLGAVDFLRARAGAAERPLVLFGVSIGTAAAAAAAPQIEGLSALILDAPIDDLRATAERLLAGAGRGALPEPFRTIALGTASLTGSVPFDAVRPQRAIARLSPEVPVLLIGAGQDYRVPPAAVRAYFATLPTLPDRKQLWIDAAAAHARVWLRDPGRYRDHLLALLAIAGVPMIE